MARVSVLGLRAIMALLVLCLASACTPIYRNHGYVPTDLELAAIKVGVDTRDSVATAIGRPSAEGLLNDEAWFYVQSRWRNYGLQKPKEIERQVVQISFNSGGTVTNIERFGLEDGQVVVLSRRVTTQNVKGRSALSQIFANVGKLNADQLFNK